MFRSSGESNVDVQFCGGDDGKPGRIMFETEEIPEEGRRVKCYINGIGEGKGSGFIKKHSDNRYVLTNDHEKGDFESEGMEIRRVCIRIFDVECERGHRLEGFHTPANGYKCDSEGCHREFGIGTFMHSCDECDRNIC